MPFFSGGCNFCPLIYVILGVRDEETFNHMVLRHRGLLFAVCRRYGRDGKYYFCFILPEAKVKRLPDALVHQVLSIAQKVERQILQKGTRKSLVGKKGRKGLIGK